MKSIYDMEKEEKSKKKTNVALYTVLATIVFFIITEVVIWGYGGYLTEASILYYPQGSGVISEAILCTFCFIVMLIFGNSYVFSQKKEKFKVGLFYGMFFLIYSVAALVSLTRGAEFSSVFSIFNLILYCALIGMAEEFLCRGFLLNEFLERFGKTKKGVWYSILVSALIFGIMHLTNVIYGSQNLYVTICQIVNAAICGIMFGIIYYKTKNIWSVIFLHAFWDFSLMISYVMVTTSMTETIINYNITYLILGIISVLPMLVTIIPFMKDIDAKPKNNKVVEFAILAYVLYLVFGGVQYYLLYEDGSIYEYGTIEVENYYTTNYATSDYKINYDKEDIIESYDIDNNLVENTVIENINMTLEYDDDNNLVITNNNTDYKINIECESLSDYNIAEFDDYYIISYIDYENNTNAFLYYNYVYKDELSNDNEYLDNIKSTFKKYLLPDVLSIYKLHDYDTEKEYLLLYSSDYGMYLLDNDKLYYAGL